MAKLVLKVDPTFPTVVKIPRAGGEPADVKFEFKHRTRDELTSWLASLKGKTDVQVILEMAVAWDLADPFDAENIGVLVQNFHAAAETVTRDYINELAGARRGN